MRVYVTVWVPAYQKYCEAGTSSCQGNMNLDPCSYGPEMSHLSLDVAESTPGDHISEEE